MNKEEDKPSNFKTFYVDPVPVEEISKHLDNIEDTLKLRGPIREKSDNYPLHITYPECHGVRTDVCSPDKEGENFKGKISLYDLVDMHRIIKDGLPLRIENMGDLLKITPYLVIDVCNNHLTKAAEECFKGSFRYDEPEGKDEIHTGAYDNIMMHVEHKDGLSRLVSSYPLHPKIGGSKDFQEFVREFSPNFLAEKRTFLKKIRDYKK